MLSMGIVHNTSTSRPPHTYMLDIRYGIWDPNASKTLFSSPAFLRFVIYQVQICDFRWWFPIEFWSVSQSPESMWLCYSMNDCTIRRHIAGNSPPNGTDLFRQYFNWQTGGLNESRATFADEMTNIIVRKPCAMCLYSNETIKCSSPEAWYNHTQVFASGATLYESDTLQLTISMTQRW